jgi:hypothetical protein
MVNTCNTGRHKVVAEASSKKTVVPCRIYYTVALKKNEKTSSLVTSTTR